jgi:hypothetical protein
LFRPSRRQARQPVLAVFFDWYEPSNKRVNSEYKFKQRMKRKLTAVPEVTLNNPVIRISLIALNTPKCRPPLVRSNPVVASLNVIQKETIARKTTPEWPAPTQMSFCQRVGEDWRAMCPKPRLGKLRTAGSQLSHTLPISSNRYR